MKSRIISAFAEGKNELEEEYKVVLAQRTDTDGDYMDYAVGFDFVIDDETKPVGLIFQDLDSAKDVFDQFCECLDKPVDESLDRCKNISRRDQKTGVEEMENEPLKKYKITYDGISYEIELDDGRIIKLPIHELKRIRDEWKEYKNAQEKYEQAGKIIKDFESKKEVVYGRNK